MTIDSKIHRDTTKNAASKIPRNPIQYQTFSGFGGSDNRPAATEVAHVIREERVGWVVPVGDVAALTAAIEDARSDPAKREAMGRRARCVAEGKYSRAAVIARYVRLMEECSNR